MTAFLQVAKTLLRHRDFTVLIICNLIVGMAHSFVMPYGSIFGTKEVGMSSWMYGIFMTVTSLSGIVLSTYLAHWSDTRFARKTILLIGGLAGGLGYLGYAWVREIWLLMLIGCLLLGIASIVFSQLFAHARNLLDESEVDAREVSLYMNVFRLCFALSWTVGPALAALVMRYYSFRGTYQVAAGLFFLFTVLVAAFIRSNPPSKAGGRETAKLPIPKLPLREAFRLPGLAAHFLAFTAFFTCWTMGMINLPLLMLDTLHGDASNVGMAYSLGPVFEIPLMFYLGVLATRMPPARLIRGAFMLAIVYFAALSLIREPWQVYPLQLLSAAIVAVSNGLAITFFQDYMPERAGAATNLFTNAMRFGSIFGYLLFGGLCTSFGHRSVFVACAMLCGLSVLLMLPRRAERIRPPREVRAAIKA